MVYNIFVFLRYSVDKSTVGQIRDKCTCKPGKGVFDVTVLKDMPKLDILELDGLTLSGNISVIGNLTKLEYLSL